MEFKFLTYSLLVILIPGLPLMVILALQNNPNRWLSNWLQAHRTAVLTGYVVSTISLLIISTCWLSVQEIWGFLKLFLVPSLVLTGVALYPFVHLGKKT